MAKRQLKTRTLKGVASHSLVTFGNADPTSIAIEAYDDDGRRHFVTFTPTELLRLRDTLERTARRDWFKDMWRAETGEA